MYGLWAEGLWVSWLRAHGLATAQIPPVIVFNSQIMSVHDGYVG